MYEYDTGTQKMYAVQGQPKSAGSATSQNSTNMLTWFTAMMSDTFS